MNKEWTSVGTGNKLCLVQIITDFLLQINLDCYHSRRSSRKYWPQEGPTARLAWTDNRALFVHQTHTAQVEYTPAQTEVCDEKDDGGGRRRNVHAVNLSTYTDLNWHKRGCGTGSTTHAFSGLTRISNRRCEVPVLAIFAKHCVQTDFQKMSDHRGISIH